jgi:hypothetical protein
VEGLCDHLLSPVWEFVSSFPAGDKHIWNPIKCLNHDFLVQVFYRRCNLVVIPEILFHTVCYSSALSFSRLRNVVPAVPRAFRFMLMWPGVTRFIVHIAIDLSLLPQFLHSYVKSKTRVRAQVNPCVICGGQSGTGTGFSPSPSLFPSVTFRRYSILTHIGELDNGSGQLRG